MSINFKYSCLKVWEYNRMTSWGCENEINNYTCTLCTLHYTILSILDIPYLFCAGTDEKAIISVLAYRSNVQRQQIKIKFKSMFGRVSIRSCDCSCPTWNDWWIIPIYIHVYTCMYIPVRIWSRIWRVSWAAILRRLSWASWTHRPSTMPWNATTLSRYVCYIIHVHVCMLHPKSRWNVKVHICKSRCKPTELMQWYYVNEHMSCGSFDL